MQQTMFEAFEVPHNEHEIRFMEFHKKNPVVWDLWQKFTKEAISHGMGVVGSQLILERIRWETAIRLHDTTADGQSVKICNHHKVFYARLWNKQNPHQQVFKTRKIEGENE